MKRLSFIILIVTSISFVLVGCRKETPIDSSLFSVEVIDGVRHIHNHGPQLGDNPTERLELVGQIGKLEGREEKDILYDPVDAIRLPNGDILILEGSGCAVKRYDKDHGYISSFGQKGQGPGDFISPFCLRLGPGGDMLYVADTRISVFSLDGSYVGGFKPEMIGGSSIHVQYRTSGMAVLSGSRAVLPSHPSMWLDTMENQLLSLYDDKGAIVRSFGAVEFHGDPQLTLNANIAFFAADSGDNVYIAYAHQNRISRYAPDGRWNFASDRPLPYEVKNMLKTEIFKSGDMEREFSWPSVSSVAKGIALDHKNRIWVLTYLKQPNRFLTFDEGENLTECYRFDVFDRDGVLLFDVPFPNVRFVAFSICGDRLYLIDSQDESCVYEYRIVDSE
jgi:hypothetical protein